MTANYMVGGDADLDAADRHALATWSGQAVPGRGAVWLELTPQQRISAAVLLLMLGKGREYG